MLSVNYTHNPITTFHVKNTMYYLNQLLCHKKCLFFHRYKPMPVCSISAFVSQQWHLHGIPWTAGFPCAGDDRRTPDVAECWHVHRGVGVSADGHLGPPGHLVHVCTAEARLGHTCGLHGGWSQVTSMCILLSIFTVAHLTLCCWYLVKAIKRNQILKKVVKISFLYWYRCLIPC